MRVVFFGTPEVAAVAFDALVVSTHEIVAVVTQPDRGRGRGRSVTSSPVKERAQQLELPVLQPPSPKDEGFAGELAAFAPDALAVVAYGHILPRAVLDVAPAVNAHFSLLPAYRGAAPVQRALMEGATETGVTVFLLEPSVDSGPILRVESTPIGADEDAGMLLERLAPIGGRLLVSALDGLAVGDRGTPQDAGKATPAPKIRPEEQRIEWSDSATQIVARIRGLSLKPGAFTTFRGKRLLVRRAAAHTESLEGPFGLLDDRGWVATSHGAVELLEVQPEGKRAMSAEEFLRGYRPDAGTLLGT